jgi:hypothetical protein
VLLDPTNFLTTNRTLLEENRRFIVEQVRAMGPTSASPGTTPTAASSTDGGAFVDAHFLSCSPSRC